MNILIVKLSAIGDVIHTLPALNAIRNHYPNARITWLVEEASSDLVKGHKSLDRVIISKRKEWIKGLFSKFWAQNLREIINFIKELRDTHYDIVFDFQALLKSSILIMLSIGKRKIGFDKGMDHDEYSFLFLNERIKPVSMENHAIKRSLMMIESLGIKSEKIEYKLPVKDSDLKIIKKC